MKDDLVEKVARIILTHPGNTLNGCRATANAIFAIARPVRCDVGKADHVAPEGFEPPTAEERDSAVLAYDFQKAAECVLSLAHTTGQEPAPTCPICAEPFKPDDICAADINEGTCHAECLEGSPVVYLDTGEPSDGPVDTFTYGQEGGR